MVYSIEWLLVPDVEQPDMRGRFPKSSVSQTGPGGWPPSRLLRDSSGSPGLHLLHRVPEDPLRDRPGVSLLTDKWAEQDGKGDRRAVLQGQLQPQIQPRPHHQAR